MKALIMIRLSTLRAYGKTAATLATLLCVGIALSLCISLPSAWADVALSSSAGAEIQNAAVSNGEALSASVSEESDADAASSPDGTDGEGTSPCHPEQASEASASKDLDATAGEEVGSDEAAEANADDSDDAAAATNAAADAGDLPSAASSGSDEAEGEGASSCHPEQASEASASKDLDATAQAEAGATAQAAASEVAEADAAATTEYVNMYRLYNPNSGEHFYTSSLDETAFVTEAGWRYEGVGWVAPKSSAVPVYRLYNPNAGDHHYTQSLEERNWLISLGWNDEGIGWYSDDSGSGIEVLRQYNPNAVAGAHNFTASSEENENLVSAGWSGEGIAWYASSQATQSIQGRWIVTSAWGSLERYWLDSTATIATSRLVDPTTELDYGAGYYAYAKSDGAVVRGKWDNGAGRVYVADDDGRLASTDNGETGWLVTGLYDGGTLQRYYMDMDVHAALTGSFEVSGSHYYGLADVGYVLREKLRYGAGMLLADNDGVLAWTEGWLITDVYDGEEQYYRIDSAPGDGLMGAHLGYFELGGSAYYGLGNEGYLARNCTGWFGSIYGTCDSVGVLTVINNGYTETVKAFVNWMLATAADDSHGYDQAYRWNEYGDYDCSSLVISALKAAGINTYSASYTGNMRSNLLKAGFVWITDISQRQYGDILLNEGHHTAIYIGDEQLVHASLNEKGTITGGEPGDQTGKEICVRSYYDRPWNGILRYVGKSYA